MGCHQRDNMSAHVDDVRDTTARRLAIEIGVKEFPHAARRQSVDQRAMHLGVKDHRRTHWHAMLWAVADSAPAATVQGDLQYAVATRTSQHVTAIARTGALDSNTAEQSVSWEMPQRRDVQGSIDDHIYDDRSQVDDCQR